MLFAEDLKVGDDFDLGTHLMAASEIIGFGELWDPLTMHVDPIGAEKSAYGALIASGMHSLSVYQRLSVRSLYSNWRVYAGRRLADVKFLRPVFADTLLRGRARVVAIEPRHPDRWLVTTLGALRVEEEPSSLEVMSETYVLTRASELADPPP